GVFGQGSDGEEGLAGGGAAEGLAAAAGLCILAGAAVEAARAAPVAVRSGLQGLLFVTGIILLLAAPVVALSADRPMRASVGLMVGALGWACGACMLGAAI